MKCPCDRLHIKTVKGRDGGTRCRCRLHGKAADLAVTWTIGVPDASEESLIGALSALRRALDATGRIAAENWSPRHDVVSTRHLALA